MEDILNIKEVSMQYGGTEILHKVSFTLHKGDFTGFLGINGAGKTSLISAIAGLRDYSGEIVVDGYNLRQNPVRVKRNIGVVPQELSFDPFLTVRQTLQFQAKLYQVGRTADVWIDELLKRLHLQEKADSDTRNLSGGMKRRLMVAQALVHKPSLIILDEPTAGVDVEIRKLLWAFITEINKQGATILLTTHYLEEVEQLCSRVIMLHKGDILYNDAKHELIKMSSNLPNNFYCTISPQQLPDAIAHLAIPTGDNGAYAFNNVSQSQIMEILQQFYVNKINITDMNIAKPGLEEIFLKYLGRGV